MDAENPQSGCETFRCPDSGKLVRVLFEDNHLIALEKPRDMLTQGDSTNRPSLISAAKTHLKAKYQKPGNVFLGMVHRLDREVSGAILFCKTSKAASRVSEQIRLRSFVKEYVALVEGTLLGSGRLEDFLDVNAGGIAFVAAKGQGKAASLEYQAEPAGPGFSKVRIRLETGRRHQIRVQFASRSLPVWGDIKYGSRKPRRTSGMALHSAALEFKHPVLQNRVRVESPPPW